MFEWLSPELAILLMYLGVIPAGVNIWLLWEEKQKPGVIWFILSMATGGAWAFLYATFTLVPDPGVTLALANLFWVTIPTAGVSLFLLAYEFTFKQLTSRAVIATVFTPILVLFVLTWFNPANLVFTPEYGVTASGYLSFPQFGGPVKFAVTKVYGYLMVVLSAGLFVGEALRSHGTRRRQSLSLLFVFSMLVFSTLVKVAGLVPLYFDPTSVVYSLSGVVFAYSINRKGLLQYSPIAREATFNAVSDVIFILDPDGAVIDTNRAADSLFGTETIGHQFDAVLRDAGVTTDRADAQTLEIPSGDERRVFSVGSGDDRYVFSVGSFEVAYGRGITGTIVVLSDITALKQHESELELLKQIFSRFFRHNIRNDLNVIGGHAQYIQTDPSDAIPHSATAIATKADKITAQAEKARAIERVISDTRTVHRSIKAIVDEVCADYTSDPTVRLKTDVDDVLVEVHPQFRLAIAELIDNAIIHQTEDGPVDVIIQTTVDATTATISIEDAGPGLPPSEIAVLKLGEETSMDHSSGLGLWLVHLITDRSNGELVIDSTDEGTRVGIRVQRVT